MRQKKNSSSRCGAADFQVTQEQKGQMRTVGDALARSAEAAAEMLISSRYWSSGMSASKAVCSRLRNGHDYKLSRVKAEVKA